MKRPRFFPALVLSVCIAGSLHGGLAEDVRGLLQDKTFGKAQFGIEIVRLGEKRPDCQVLFRHESDIPMMPASNLKLVTTSAALERLGADFKFRTVLARRGEDLVLIGDGDPTFGDGEAMRRVGWDITSVFKQWVDLLKKQNLTSVRNLIIDDSIFDQTFFHPDWDRKELLKDYRAEVAGMSLNLNVLDVFVRPTAAGQVVQFRVEPPTRYGRIVNQCLTGNDDSVWLSRDEQGNNFVLRGEAAHSNDAAISVPVHDPSLFAAYVLAEMINDAGIHLTGKVMRDRTIRALMDRPTAKTPPTSGPALQVLAIYQTPLENVLSRANKDSINLYAECLCKRLGAAATGQSGSWENGTAVLADFLAKSVGAAAGEFSFDDGCGLSRNNGVSANALCQVLEHDWYGPNRQAFLTSLAIGGVDGKTLKKRFTDDLKGRVFAKTGYIRGVSCLTGFLKSKNAQMFAFSILVNDIYTDDARKLQDRIVKAIDQSTAVLAQSSSINP